MDVTWAPGPHSPAEGHAARPLAAARSPVGPHRPPLGVVPLFLILVLMGPVGLGLVTSLRGGAQVAAFTLWFAALGLVAILFGYDSRDGNDWKGASTELPGPAGQRPPKSPNVTWK